MSIPLEWTGDSENIAKAKAVMRKARYRALECLLEVAVKDGNVFSEELYQASGRSTKKNITPNS